MAFLVGVLLSVSLLIIPPVHGEESVQNDEIMKVELYAGLDWNNPNDDLLSQTILNKLESSLKKKLQFHRVASTHSRGWRHVAQDSNSCVFNSLKNTQRLERAIFSRYPISVSPALRFVTSKRSIFEAPFSFEQLDHQIHQKAVGLVDKRFYSSSINQFKLNNPDFFYIHKSVDRTERLLGMLTKGRIMGFIDFGESVNQAMLSMGHQMDIRMLEIANEQEFMEGFFACSKTPEGRKIIDLLNHEMKKKSFQQWAIGLHRQYFKQFETQLTNYLKADVFTSH